MRRRAVGVERRLMYIPRTTLTRPPHTPPTPLQKHQNQAAEASYRPTNPYHSATHAADVVQTAAAMLLADGLGGTLAPLELLACILAAVVHDIDHQGEGVGTGFGGRV